MRTIIRCPSCFTYVYSDARRCHGCGEKTGRRALLPRGAWIFAVLAAAIFTLARGIDLQQEKRAERRHQIATAENVGKVSSFLRTWLTGSSDEVGAFFASGKPFAGDLQRARARYPNVLPATAIGTLKIEEGESLYHGKAKDGQVTHRETWGLEASKPALRVSRRPPGLREYDRSWWATPYQFEADVTKDGVSYTIHGKVCVYENLITCLTIDRVESTEGIVKPEN